MLVVRQVINDGAVVDPDFLLIFWFNFIFLVDGFLHLALLLFLGFSCLVCDVSQLRQSCKVLPDEAVFASTIVRSFQQQVVGFDVLRSESDGLSYVIDINGWSFVKGNMRWVREMN